MGTYTDLFKLQRPKSKDATSQDEGNDHSEHHSFRSEFRTEKRSETQPNQLPIKRRTTRYSFEFYEDQIFQLKQLKREAEDRAENLTLSAIARDALDLYLKSKAKK